MKKKQETVQHKNPQQQAAPNDQRHHGDEAAPAGQHNEAVAQAEKKHKHTSHIRKSGRHSRDNFGSYRGY